MVEVAPPYSMMEGWTRDPTLMTLVDLVTLSFFFTIFPFSHFRKFIWFYIFGKNSQKKRLIRSCDFEPTIHHPFKYCYTYVVDVPIMDEPQLVYHRGHIVSFKLFFFENFNFDFGISPKYN
jgi:hypothetical protein